MPRPDEVAFDLRIDVGQLLARQVARVFIEAARRTAGVFHDHGGGGHAELLLAQVGGGRGHVPGIVARVHVHRGDLIV